MGIRRLNRSHRASDWPCGSGKVPLESTWLRMAVTLGLFASLLSISGCAFTSRANNSNLSPSALVINSTPLPQGQLQSRYQSSLTASGGRQPYTWSVASGALPMGLALTSSSGTISGTPTQSGTSTFTVGVVDSSSPLATARAAVTISIATSSSTVAVQLSPTSASAINGATQQFNATVTGSSNTNVTWSLTGTGCTGSSCGSLSQAGNTAVYSAPAVPPSPPTVTVTATSVADITKSAPATVTVVGQIAENVAPTNPHVGVGMTQQFSASVLGTASSVVTWNLTGTGCSGTACGTISNSGLYTAPATVPSPANVTVTATSVADTTKSGSTTVTIVGSANGPPPVAPALPAATVDVTMPTQGSSNCPTLTTGSDCIRQVPAGNAIGLQIALNASTCGDTIVLQAGSTYSGNFTIPNIGSCTGWVIVESSKVSNLPSGTRVSLSSASDMAKLSGTALTAALRFAATGIHNFRFIGLEISCATGVCDVPNDLAEGLAEIDGGLPSSAAQTPDHIIIDRCYIHGTPTQNIRSGIRANGTNIAVIDSYISEIHENGFDSQAIVDWNGAGPLLIQNNFLEAASENILFGGAGTAVSRLIPSDITIVGNYFYKNPSWLGKAAPYNWVIKNLLEFKNAQRVLVHGNVFAYCCYAAQDGSIVLVTPRSYSGDSWATTADLTFTDNLLEHAAIGFVISHSDYNHVPTSQPPRRILIQNNVLTDIDRATWGTGSGGWAFLLEDIAGGPNPNNLTNWHDLTIDHNDLIDTTADIFLAGGTGPSAVPAGPIQFTNNMDSNDITGQGISAGNAAIYFYLIQVTWNKNVLTGALTNNYPGGTFFPTLSQIGFTNYSSTNLAGANYQLLPSSPYHNAGTDGNDIGVWDWSTWNTATAHAVSGLCP